MVLLICLKNLYNHPSKSILTNPLKYHFPLQKVPVETGDSQCEAASVDNVSPSDMTVHANSATDTNVEVVVDNDVENVIVELEEKNGVSSCAEIDCSVSCNMGTQLCHAVAEVPISTTEVKSSSETEDPTVVHSEQIDVCDQDKSANSEPDSSDSVCQATDAVQVEVECDSGSSRSVPVAPDVGSEVDSTETSVSKLKLEALLENTHCDSCNSEKSNSVLDRSNLPGPSHVTDSIVCTSSSKSSSLLVLNTSSVPDASFSNRNIVDRLSQVDSSTDEPRGRSCSVSGSVLLDSSVTSNSSTSVLLLDNNIQTSTHTQQNVDNEVSNSYGFETVQSNMGRNLLGNASFTDPFSVSSNSSSDIVPMPNRHLKFLTDSNYSTDMTVDSTTQFIPSVGASSLLNTAGLPPMVSYDSDSMDVTSASETGILAGYEDCRRGNDDSLTGFPEPMSSTSNDSTQPPKEKKKVLFICVN